MATSKKTTGTDQSIGCSVTNCTYNEGGCTCVAQHINVNNDRATTQAETYCSTFKSKGNCCAD